MTSEPYQVEVVRSPRRRKTVAAKLLGDTVRVYLPVGLSAADEQRYVAQLVARIARKHRSDDIDIAARARAVARRYRLPQATTIEWVGNQDSRWGSCSTGTGTVRISDRVAAFPPWVVDYVIVHELAHLVEANHSAAFWKLVARYPKAERARGFLIAKGLEED
jgi:predicted metal-dependent hydrolase